LSIFSAAKNSLILTFKGEEKLWKVLLIWVIPIWVAFLFAPYLFVPVSKIIKSCFLYYTLAYFNLYGWVLHLLASILLVLRNKSIKNIFLRLVIFVLIGLVGVVPVFFTGMSLGLYQEHINLGGVECTL
jgi:hypothetical protein